MGIVRMGPPEELVLLLKRALNVLIFVETGTFKGGTAVWAANHFERVLTIEYSKTLFDEVVGSYNHLQNIDFLFGDSRIVLKDIITKINEPAVFWLDAHWCGIDSYGPHDQCPIIEELGIIRSAGVDHCILIDDARLFLSPPPLPNVIEQWPTIDLICNTIQSYEGSYYMVVFEDVIIAVPTNACSLIAEFCQAANTKAWREQGKREAPNGIDLVKQGARLIARDVRHKLRQVVGI